MKKKLKDNKYRCRNLYWRLYGYTLTNPGLPNDPRSLLFICKGNICRSPFAERLAARIAKNTGYAFNSAGLEVSQSLTPPENAILAARSFGVSLDDHKSRKINHKMINSADMIFVMEPWHLRSLKNFFPYQHAIQNKVFLLPLFQKKGTEIKETYHRYNISDPYDKPCDQFQICFRNIEKCLLELFTRISP